MEIEEVVFDTLGMRSQALHGALRDEGIDVSIADVIAAHSGSTARLAIDTLQIATSLDAVSRDLVIRRTSDAVRQSLNAGLPAFDRAARDAVQQLAINVPMAVVTRASHDDAVRMIEQAELDVCFRTVLSLDDRARHEQPAVWSRAASRLFGLQAVAVGPPQIVDGAREAGLRTIAITASGTAAHDTLVSIAQLDISYLASLSETRELS